MTLIEIKIVQRQTGGIRAQNLLQPVRQPGFAGATTAGDGNEFGLGHHDHVATTVWISWLETRAKRSSSPLMYLEKSNCLRTNARPFSPSCRARLLSRK